MLTLLIYCRLDVTKDYTDENTILGECIPYGRKFSRELIFAVFTVDWRSTKIKSAK